MLSPNEFRIQYEQYFGPTAMLPIVVSFSDSPRGLVEKTHGCMFKLFEKVVGGSDISLDEQSINCMGGKFYAGFKEAPPQMYNFVSSGEKYKASPECVRESVDNLAIISAPGKFINFVRLDRSSEFNDAIGLIFLATPDILSGLFTWANYDQNDRDTVEAPWGSGCSQTVSALASENARDGKHCYIGMLDVSARPYFAADILSFSIPMSRFSEISETLSQCCVAGSSAWKKLRERIDSTNQLKN